MKVALALVAVLLLPAYARLQPGAAASGSSVSVRRTILALYDSRFHKNVRDTRIHYLLEMPLNHLGLIVEYHDIDKGLPDLRNREDIRGVLTWLESDSMKDPQSFLRWAGSVIDHGRKLVIFGELSVTKDLNGRRTPSKTVDGLLLRMGIRSGHDWNGVTYRTRIVQRDPQMVEFERKYPSVLPSYEVMHAVAPMARSHLRLRRDENATTDCDVVITSTTGGYVAAGFTHYASPDLDQLQWYLNPFAFFRVAFGTDDFPKPDTTTVVGRRMYYSHIDGDGWRNRTEVPEYREAKLTSAEVILKRAIQPFSDLPVTVAPIAADLDEKWYGGRESQKIARETLALPWVEAGSHTYSHPLDWEYLSHLAGPAKTAQTGRPWLESLVRFFGMTDHLERILDRPAGDSRMTRGHERPRTYNLYPFSIEHEVVGAAQTIERFCPRGKKVKVLQWSGSTFAFEEMLAAVRKAGLRNLNGGDTRFDPEFPSHAWVSGLSRQSGKERQIYASSSNENTYTDLWTDRFFGFRYWRKTVENTGTPRRLTPVNLYYHMYSGEKMASLKALLDNLAFVRTLELAPVTTSHYASVVEGFFSTQIDQLHSDTWVFSQRDGMHTVRFDDNTICVDYERSYGVIGDRRDAGRLYVALDPHIPRAVVATARGNCIRSEYRLLQSRWPVQRLLREPAGFRFEASGFGPGELVWLVAPNRTWLVRATTPTGHEERLFRSGADGVLHLELASSGMNGVAVQVRRMQ